MRRILLVMLPALLVAVTPTASAASVVEAKGEFTAMVDFTTLTLTPNGSRCLLEVEGDLFFSGTLDGTATGVTTALVFASCEQVLVNPPGTFRDVFRTHLEFTGTLDGWPAQADITYLGTTGVGGDVAGLMILTHGLNGVLAVDAIVATGGTYEGAVIGG